MTVASDIQLKLQQLAPEEIELIILDALRDAQGALTIHDLVARTGLAPHILEPVFRSMVLRYDCTVDVRSDGELIYRFDPALKPLDGGENLRAYKFRQALWRAFTVFYKILIVIILVGYVILFMLLIMALLVARMSSRDDNNSSSTPRRSEGGSMQSSWGTYWFYRSLIGTRGAARPMSRFEPLPPKDPRPVWEKVFAYVFGHADSTDDPLVDRRELLALIVSKQGVIAPLELSAHTGWSPEASERESSKLLAEYDGGVEILEDGSTIFAFDTLRDVIPAGTSPLARFWQRYEFKKSYSGNTSGAFVFITLLNLFVLASSLWIAPTMLLPELVAVYAPELMTPAIVGLVLIPALFSLSFFGIPLWRNARLTAPENKAREQRNVRRMLLHEIYERTRRGETTMEEFSLIDAALRRRRPEDVHLPAVLPRALNEALTTIAHEWGAPIEINDEGQRIYDFSRIAKQYAEAASYRARPGSIRTRRLQDDFASFDDALMSMDDRPADHAQMSMNVPAAHDATLPNTSRAEGLASTRPPDETLESAKSAHSPSKRSSSWDDF